MERPSYLSKYQFDWELFDVVIGGKSSLDSRFFISQLKNDEQVFDFLKGYGLNHNDPVHRAELFGNFQEALQFVRRYFLKEGTSDGLELRIPQSLYMITDVSELFLMAAKVSVGDVSVDNLWADIILKVMNTILHVDKDLRSNYFTVIQTQTLDRFYKYVFRGENEKLFLGIKGTDDVVPLVDFETKVRKSRDSVIIKLLHKTENVAEELFDRVGVRFITENRFNSLRVVKFLIDHSIVIPNNIKPSRSLNSLIDIPTFVEKYAQVVNMAVRNNLSEERFIHALDRACFECPPSDTARYHNRHSATGYQSLQFTCRYLIKYKNPFRQEIQDVRKLAKSMDRENELVKKVLALDLSYVSRDVRFFYPFEVQIVDAQAHKENTEGKSSHIEYKKSQNRTARDRVFKSLLEYLGK